MPGIPSSRISLLLNSTAVETLGTQWKPRQPWSGLIVQWSRQTCQQTDGQVLPGLYKGARPGVWEGQKGSFVPMTVPALCLATLGLQQSPRWPLENVRPLVWFLLCRVQPQRRWWLQPEPLG